MHYFIVRGASVGHPDVASAVVAHDWEKLHWACCTTSGRRLPHRHTTLGEVARSMHSKPPVKHFNAPPCPTVSDSLDWCKGVQLAQKHGGQVLCNDSLPAAQWQEALLAAATGDFATSTSLGVDDSTKPWHFAGAPSLSELEQNYGPAGLGNCAALTVFQDMAASL
jgi:hypothetical protein